MMNLETTNWILGVMAAVSVLEAIVLIGLAIAGLRIYRQTTQTLTDLEARQIAPLREKVERILVDVQGITARVSQQTARVDDAITGTIDRVDETAERVKHSVRDRVAQAAGVVKGVRAIIVSLLTREPGRERPFDGAHGGPFDEAQGSPRTAEGRI
jgi:hypothetical protein